MHSPTYLFLFLLLPVLLFGRGIPADLAWPHIDTNNKPGTYWWWMGSSVDSANLTWNLETLHQAGIGAAHIIPIYGVKGEEKKYIDFLSPKWMRMLAYTTKEAHRLGMNTDMSTTTGWPFGGSHVTPKDAASTIEPTIYRLFGGQSINEECGAGLQAAMAYSESGETVDLTETVQNGVLEWLAPAGEWRVFLLQQTGTKQMVKRAAPGNEGLVLDPFSPASLKTYLQRYDDSFAGYGTAGVRAQYHDSYEYYNADWTDDLFAQFQSRRGYDLKAHLPALFGFGDADVISRVRADYRTTLAELHLDYIRGWSDWSHKHGWITRNEAHGAPGNWLDLYAAADVPETETFGAARYPIPGLRFNPDEISTSDPPNPLILKFSSSAAHVAGKQLVASETCTWLRDHFKTSLAMTKPEIDQLFISGINHIFYHGNAWSPKEAEWPGWMFYASTHFEQKNAFWRDIPALNAYAARCQSILQSGAPANDVLLYWPLADIWHAYSGQLLKTLNVHDTDWLTDSAFGGLALSLMQNGYAFDYISDAQIEQLDFADGVLFSGDARYKTIVVPQTQYMPLGTWHRLLDLAADGATVILHKSLPADVPGLAELTDRRAELQALNANLHFRPAGRDMLRAAVGDGAILLATELNAALNTTGARREPITDLGVKYIRRTHDEGLHYFFVNHSDRAVNGWVALGEPCTSAVILDPRFEKRAGVAAVRQEKGKTEIYVQLESGESCFVRTFREREAQGRPWPYLEATDRSLTIDGSWQVDFIDGPELPASYRTNSLASWTSRGDEAADRFAGTARYSITFDLPSTPAGDWLLDLGDVRESARVNINGEDVGVLWSLPFRIPVGRFLKKGENTLHIEVTNLSANRLRDLDLRGVPWKKFFFVNVFYKPFDASSWPLMDSGLLGPVTLVEMKKKKF